MKKLTKLVLFFFFFSVFLTFGAGKTRAAEDKFVTIINPVRGGDFWSLAGQGFDDFVDFQKKVHREESVAATWLLRPDYLFDASNDFSGSPGDEIGLFLEVTPTWAEKAGVEYQSTKGWNLAQNVFLSGYNPKERILLLETAFAQFNEIFGRFPQTVGAWHIDPFSADFVSRQYGVVAILVCADQFSTDGYRIWGGWWGVPFFPSSKNLLVPASSKKDKLPVVILWWAARDPLNGYGSGMEESTYSVQANDYLVFHDLDTEYFSQLADFYLEPLKGDFGQLTMGLENDYRLDKFGDEYRRQVKVLNQKGARFLTAASFARWYQARFPQLSPSHEIGGNDLLGTSRESRWIMTTDYRIGLIRDDAGDWKIRDKRLYRPVWPDPYLGVKNLAGELYWQIPAQADQVGQGDEPVLAQGGSFLTDRAEIFSSSKGWLVAVVIIFVALGIFFRPEKKALALIGLGGGLVAATMVRSGMIDSLGMGFWGPNGHDGIWHLSLINQVQKGIPPLNPVFSGERLSQYHWGFDYLAGLAAKTTSLSSLDVYFRLFPLLTIFFIGFLGYRLVNKVAKDKTAGWWFVWLSFFAGSFGWLVTLLREGKIGGESLFWAMQSASTLINPPFALSLVLLLLGLNLWFGWKGSTSWKKAVFLGILFGLTAGIKVYGGILVIIALFLYWARGVVVGGKSRFNFITWSLAAITGGLLLFFMGVFSGPPALVFKPLWFTHSLVESLDKLYWPKLAGLRINLVGQWLSWKLPFLLAIELGLVVLFVVGNLGLRVIGLWHWGARAAKKKIEDFDWLMVFIGLPAFVLPLIFVQRGTTWNTIQFFYYFLFIVNFYLAFWLARLSQRGRRMAWLAAAFGILAALTSFSTLKDYFGYPPPAAVPYYELEGLGFLSRQDDGVVLTYPYNQFKKKGVDSPLPLYLYETTAYVSAFGNKIAHLEDEMNLEITGFSWRERRGKVDKFFASRDRIWARGFLVNNRIDYIYLVNDQFLPMQPQDYGVKVIFDNGQVRIYQVSR